MVLGFKISLKVKEIWNLSNAILSKFNFLTALNNKIKLLFQLSKNILLNETIIISNRKVFDYGHKDRTNGKNIINFMVNKTEKKLRQANETSVSLILINNTDTS